MYKLPILLPVLAFSFSTNAQTSPDIDWQTSLGGSLPDLASSVRQTNDGGYVVAGWAGSNNGNVNGNNGGNDYWVVKLDGSGAIQWQKCLGGSGDDRATDIQQTSDGGFIVAGQSDSNNGDVSGNPGSSDYWIVKLNSSGDLDWQRSLGGAGFDAARSVQQTLDGGYIVAGSSDSNDGDVSGNNGATDYWVVKLNNAGTIEWQKSFGGSGNDNASAIRQISDGSYLVAGASESIDGDVIGNQGGWDMWVLKLDPFGDLQWQRSLGGTGDDGAGSIHETSDNGYIVAGSTGSNDGDVSGNHGLDDCWVVKLDASGVLQWQKTLGGSGVDLANSIHQTLDGGYIVGASTSSNDGDVTGNSGGAYDYWVVKLNGSGSLQWQKAMGGSGDDRSASTWRTSDGGSILAGLSNSNDGDVSGNNGGYDYWVVKLAQDPTSIHVEEDGSGFEVFPNPTQGDLVVSLTLEAAVPVQLYLYNATGQLLSTLVDESRPAGEFTFRFSTDMLPAGIYQLRCGIDGRIVFRKVVKM